MSVTGSKRRTLEARGQLHADLLETCGTSKPMADKEPAVREAQLHDQLPTVSKRAVPAKPYHLTPSEIESLRQDSIKAMAQLMA